MKHDIPDNYKIIPSFPDYCVEEYGQYVVRLLKNGNTHVLSNNGKGVTLFKDGVRYYRSKRQLANEAWGRNIETQRFHIEGWHDNGGRIESLMFNSLKEASYYTGAPMSAISSIINKRGRYSSNGWSFRKVTEEG